MPPLTPRQTLWAKNALFVALCVAGGGAVAAGLLRRDRVETPEQFQPARFQPAAAEPNDWTRVRDEVDRQFRANWQAKGLAAAPRADELTIARRLSLALVGTAPSLEEIQALEQVPRPQRVEWFVSRLLEDRRYSDYVAERLARAYVGAENGPFLVFRRRRFVSWLSDHLQQNTPYDEIVRRLIADEGLWTSDPAVNFITATCAEANGGQPDEVRLAGRTARVLGMRIDCLQCHDDKLATLNFGLNGEDVPGTQQHFHQLAAFFGATENSLTGVREGDGKYKVKYLGAEEEAVVPPRAPFLEQLHRGHGPPRAQLARWVTHPENKAFARAAVNRVWALLLARPLVQPLDDIPLLPPPGGYPPGLETLAEDFIAHGYDLQRLIRLITATEVFQHDSRADFEITLAHDQAWAVFPLTRLRPEQVAGSVIQAASLTTLDATSHIVWRLAQFGQTTEFVERYGDVGEDEFTDRGGTIPQRLLLMNGELVQERTQANLVTNAASRIAAVTPKNSAVVNAAYLAVLTRLPTEAERAHFVARLDEARGNDRFDAVADLYWVLINSTEFSWNH